MTAPETEAATPAQAELDRRAVDHVARRMRESGDVSYVLGWGTEAHDRIVAAEAEAHGCSRGAMANLLATPIRSADQPHQPAQIPALRDRIEALETLLDERVPGWRDDLEPRQLRLFGGGGGR